ncbi:hypothetical protein [Burkholderia seminalis]|uniref:hypothetical protein n=1 Tax=Burkholderia seminalis TaxID=488731 RepID=UPI0026549E46|nr:hypothetical protein [Burkholderia seminalis]MDN7854058.1 hypothetical protein [Burkholderia seminalis]
MTNDLNVNELLTNGPDDLTLITDQVGKLLGRSVPQLSVDCKDGRARHGLHRSARTVVHYKLGDVPAFVSGQVS